MEIQYKVVDHAPSVGIREEFEMFEKINARNAALNRQDVDFEAGFTRRFAVANATPPGDLF